MQAPTLLLYSSLAMAAASTGPFSGPAVRVDRFAGPEVLVVGANVRFATGFSASKR